MYFRTILIMKYFEKHSLMSLKTESAARHSCSVKFHMLFLFFVAAMFFISILSLFSYHIWLIAKNRTTIGNPYNSIYTKDEQKSLQCHVIQSVSFNTVTVFVVK